MDKMNPDVDAFFSKAKKWQKEMECLRGIVLDCQLTEELKWYQPCYTMDNNNILIISGFKEYCALNFFKGALLRDKHGLLIKPGKNTQAGRQIRFTSVEEIEELAPILKAYILEAAEAEKAGLQIEYKKTADYTMPEELQTKFLENPALKNAFEALTPGRQRGYLLYFSQAKQSTTRATRIEKNIDRIFDGQGLNDR